MRNARLAMALAFASAVTAAAQDSGSTANRIVQPGAAAENRLAEQVRHSLATLSLYGVFDNLEYSVDGAAVTLSGSAVRPILKSDAEAAVKAIEGVEKITNNIRVLPVSPTDDQFRRAVYRAVYGDANLSRYALRAAPPIRIVVDNGHVTLAGAVGSQNDKELAGVRANEVPGAFSVTNDLRVTSD
jgi:hyperosmotically inducible periplasmic protein